VRRKESDCGDLESGPVLSRKWRMEPQLTYYLRDKLPIDVVKRSKIAVDNV
jgi:hypothetical protein